MHQDHDRSIVLARFPLAGNGDRRGQQAGFVVKQLLSGI
jgi:hypothetical protein